MNKLFNSLNKLLLDRIATVEKFAKGPHKDERLAELRYLLGQVNAMRAEAKLNGEVK